MENVMSTSVIIRRWAIFLAGTLMLAGCVGSGSTEPPLNAGPFLELARTTACASGKNNLYVIDNRFVFHDRSGDCPDNSYSRTLYGTTPEVVLCRQNDSIAGPQSNCVDAGVRELFSAITNNADQADLGIGLGHKVTRLNTATIRADELNDLLRATTLAQSAQSGIKVPRNVVIRDAESWHSLWADHQGIGSAAPGVDFNKQMVIGIFLGERPLGCYTASIDTVTKRVDSIEIAYSVTDRSAVCTLPADAANPAPMHLVAIDMSRLSVDFHRQDADVVKMTDIATGVALQFDQPEEIVVTDAAKWSELWNAHQKSGAKPSAVPDIDFGNQIVIGVTAGQKPGPCNELLIDKIVHTGSMLVVNYTQRDVHEICLAVVSGPTYPQHFVVIERQEVPVQFVKRNGDTSRVAFERISVPGSAMTIEQALVVRDAGAWNKLWARANGNLILVPEAPVIDFTKKMLIAVFMGTQPNGCFGASIDTVSRMQEDLLVEVSKRVPGPDAICTQALTSPADVVAVDRSDAMVLFESRTQRR